MSWVEVGVYQDGINGTKCRVLMESDQIKKNYDREKEDIYENVSKGFRLAQEMLIKAGELQKKVLTWSTELPPDDWHRLQWIAWKAFGCHVTKAKALDETPLFTREQWLTLLGTYYKVKGGLIGGGTVTVKVGFPGIWGCVCRAFFGVQGGYLQGYVADHLAIGRAATGTYHGIPVVKGDIHIAVKEVSSRWNDGDNSKVIAVTLLHEAYHRYANSIDVFYLEGGELKGRNKKTGRECFKNADSHAKFWMVTTGEAESEVESEAAWTPWIASAEYRSLNLQS